MSDMKVQNRMAITNLSRKSLRSNRRRNLVAILAIVLTATLFTALFTVGGSLMKTMQTATMRQVGTSSHAGFKDLTQAQYEKIITDSKIKDYSYNIYIAQAENPALNKTSTEIRYTEDKDAAWSFCAPTTGRLPKSKYDLATSTTVLDALGVPHKLGQTVSLTFTADGKRYTQDFTLCGFWKGDPIAPAEEAYVSREYCDEVAPRPTQPSYVTGDTTGCGGIHLSLWFSSAWDIDGQMDALCQRLQLDEQIRSGVNWAYSTSDMDASSYALIAGLLALILASCYLIIYNVFSISVSRDIRFYGLLKTIGTTGKQLKRLVRRQALVLSVVGIPFGLALGFAVGRLLLPAILGSTVFATTQIEITVNPLIFLAAALFTLLTVRISCIRPCLMAARVSPIEALRWTEGEQTHRHGKKALKAALRKTHTVTPFRMALASLRRDRRKAVTVILSLTLSLVLLNGTYTMVRGFDMDKYLEDYTVSDFTLTDASLSGTSLSSPVLDSISDDTFAQIRSLPGIEQIGGVWLHAGMHRLSKQAYRATKDIIKAHPDTFDAPYTDGYMQQLNNQHRISDFLYGVDSCLWDKLELHDATLDKEKFASGDYVIVSAFDDTSKYPYYHTGDKVTLNFGNGHKKTYTVLAIGDMPYALTPKFSYLLDISFVLPADEYHKQAKQSGAMLAAFNVDDAHMDNAEQWIQNYTEKVENNLSYTSRATGVKSFQSACTTYGVVGGALTLILALIGILNFTNTMISSVDARRRELAVLQSVGMTGQQLRRMLSWEGLLYALITLALTVTVGSAVTYELVHLLSSEMWYFTWHFTVLPLALCAPVLLVLCLLVPTLCYRSLRRHTIVERLRETE